MHIIISSFSVLPEICPNFEIFRYRKTGKYPAAVEKAKELGYKPVILAESLQAEALHAGKYAAAIACWRHLPLAITNWLGPRIVRYLP